VTAGVGQPGADAVPQSRARRVNPGRIEADPVVGDGHRDPARRAAAGGEHGAAQPAVRRRVTQRLPGGGAEGIDGRRGHVEVLVDIAPHVQSARRFAGLPPQRGPEILQAVPAAEYLPGQCVHGPPRLGHDDAPRHRPSGQAHRPQHAQHVIVYRVRRTPFCFLGG